MNLLSLLYFLVAQLHAGELFRRLIYVDLLQPLSIDPRLCHRLFPYRRASDFYFWQLLLVLLCNPVVVFHYARICASIVALLYSIAILFYLFVCYCIGMYLVVLFSAKAGHTIMLYNRGSIVRHSFYFVRCYMRGVWEGHRVLPHMMQA